MNKTIVQILAAREGGRVKRGHALPFVGSYDNAQHTYGALSLLLLLHPNPSLALIRALCWHDVAERWFGDLPATAKEGNPDLREVYEAIESHALGVLGLSQTLLPEEQQWLKSIDTLELLLWCREELAMGNRNVTQWYENCVKYMDKRLLDKTVPAPLALLYGRLMKRPHARLSDYFNDIERLMEGTDGPGEAGAGSGD